MRKYPNPYQYPQQQDTYNVPPQPYIPRTNAPPPAINQLGQPEQQQQTPPPTTYQQTPYRPTTHVGTGYPIPPTTLKEVSPPPTMIMPTLQRTPPPPSTERPPLNPSQIRPPPMGTQPPQQFRDYEDAGNVYSYTQPPPTDIQSQMQKLTLQSYDQHDGSTINTDNIDALPRPTGDSIIAEVPQPDVQPLFTRYQTTLPVDMSKAQASSKFIRTTIQCVPNAPTLLSKWSLPFGAILQPFAEGEEIPVINFGSCGIIRCFKCRTYINPFVTFVDHGKRWQCNICKSMNQVHHDYYCELDPQTGLRKDIAERKELTHGACEFIAPQEYMARTPQPPAYLFVIDVSYSAVRSGMVQVVAQSILNSLDKLPGDSRTMIGFITFNSTIHFYNLKKTLSQPQMLVVGDLESSLVPRPTDLLVNLQDSRVIVEQLLKSLASGNMFRDTEDAESALGAALNAAGRVLGPIGGKLCVFLSNLPTLGPNSLSNRENHTLYGTDQEAQLLIPRNDNYKELALLYNKDQICVDLFITSEQYVDLATIGCLPKYTGGTTYFYPAFRGEEDGKKLAFDIQRVLTRETGFEAVMRVRVSSGLKISNFYGHFFIRGQDLMALPNVDSDQTFGIEFQHTGSFIATPNACIQVAVLYTSSNGERRIRVQTVTLPITSTLQDLYRYSDINATMALLGKVAVSEAPKNGLNATRDKIRDIVVGTLRFFKTSQSLPMQHTGFSNQLMLPDSLRLLPLYVSALAKTPALTGGKDVRADERVASFHYISTCSINKFILYIHPCLYSIHDLTQLGDSLPPIIPLTKRRITQNGIYLIDDGNIIYVWAGKQSNQTVFEQIYEAIHYVNAPEKFAIKEDNIIGANVAELVQRLRKRSGYMTVKLIRQSTPLEREFVRRLVEDKTLIAMGYEEFLSMIHSQIGR